jgi:photosystem II stability/assembly factor-like uncharacterized protein
MARSPRDLPRPADELLVQARANRAAIARAGLEVMRLKESINPAPKASLGFASRAVTLAIDPKFGGLVDLAVPLDEELAARIISDTVRLFRWDAEAEQFRLVPMSAAADPPDFAWGRVSESGTYLAIGLPNDPNTLAALDIFRVMLPFEDTIKARGDFAAFTNRICGLILCAPELSPGGRTICDICLGVRTWNLPELAIVPDRIPSGGRYVLPPPAPAPRCEQWVNIGPANVTGVIRALAAHPAQPDTLFAGAQMGGVWRTIDGGKTWSPTMDRESKLVVYALGMSRANPDFLYAAMYSAPGFSLYRSVDGGWSWSERGLLTTLSMPSAIAVHPTIPNTVYIASYFGLHKSIDGGSSFVVQPCIVDGQTQANTTSAFDGNIDDVKLDPDSPATIYISVRTRGVFKSTNAGSSWIRVGAGIVFDVRDDGGTTRQTGLNGEFRTVLAIGEDKRPGRHGTQFLVAKVQGTILTSPDGGATWRALPGSNHGDSPFSWWTTCVAVCPADEDFIVAGGLTLTVTLNASAANPAWTFPPGFSQYSIYAPFHVDQQAIAFLPNRPDDFYYANDGMIGLVGSRGASNAVASDGLIATQCGRVAVSQSPELVVGCVTDHNGTIRTGRATFAQWERIDWPEGGAFVIDPTDAQVMFSHPQGAVLSRSRDGGATWTGVGAAINVGAGRRLNTRLIAIRPDDNSKVWLSAMYGRVHFSLDGGTTWDFVKDAAGAPWLVDGFDDGDDGPFAFAFAPNDTRVLYIGTRRGYLWRTSTAATAAAGWQQLNTPLPGSAAATFLIQACVVHPSDPAILYIGYFSNTLSFSPVWRGNVGPGGTVTWTDCSGAFPNTSLPHRYCSGLVIDPKNPNRLWATSAAGVFVTEDGGNWWRPFNEGLPRVPISGLQLRPRDRTLYLSTWGRGVFARVLTS